MFFIATMRIGAAVGVLLASAGVAAQTRVVSYSRSAQAVVIEHQGQLQVLRADDRKPQWDLVVERVGDDGVELRFTGLPGADVIARVSRGADLQAMRRRFSAPRPSQTQIALPATVAKPPAVAPDHDAAAPPVTHKSVENQQ